MRSRSCFAIGLAALALGTSAPAVAADAASEAAADRAVEFIASRQQPDGGFEVAGFPGFETPDAVLAIAEASQRGQAFDAAQALAAVRAVTRNGKSALNYLDDLADGAGPLDAPGPGLAAKLVLTVAALGLDPHAFDPDGDGATDLVARMDAGARPDGSYGAFNATLVAALANVVIGRAVPAGTRSLVLAAQQANGGWNFGGDATGDVTDPDTTGLALEVIVAARDSPADALARAVGFLAGTQQPDGSWGERAPNPNSTAVAVLGLSAAGQDVSSGCWADVPSRLRALQAGDGHIVSPFDEFGVNTFATAQAVQALLRKYRPRVVLDRRDCPNGYRMFAADGAVSGFGGTHASGTPPAATSAVVGGANTPSDQGYIVVRADGSVASFGDAPALGSLAGQRLVQPVVAGAVTPSNRGYFLFARDGGVFTFGDAAFEGSLGGMRLNQPVVAAAVTPTGRGYWLFAADGGVFTFGDAAFLGSMAARRLNQPIVSAAATKTGDGYWLFARDGGVFTLGAAAFMGSMGDRRLNAPIVGAALTNRGDGYRLAGADGGVFTFGGAEFLGALADRRFPRPVVAIAS